MADHGHWPDILASLERLMTLLQQHPPPIDYQARRTAAGEADAFTESIEIACRIHPSARPATLLVRQLWERFTGGGITYAPESLRLDGAAPDYAAFHYELAVRDADLLHVAHRQLQRTLNEAGPATWLPSAPDEFKWPDAAAHFASVDHAGRD